MNIFVLDTDPEKAAKYHCDKHAVRMLMETAQLLSSVHWTLGQSAPYRLTHKNHPCAVWARTTAENYEWLINLGLALCSEYTRRYSRRHKSQDVIEWCRDHDPNLPREGLTRFVRAMPAHCKISDDPVECYREYYRVEKRRFAKWKEGNIPEWFN